MNLNISSLCLIVLLCSNIRGATMSFSKIFNSNNQNEEFYFANYDFETGTPINQQQPQIVNYIGLADLAFANSSLNLVVKNYVKSLNFPFKIYTVSAYGMNTFMNAQGQSVEVVHGNEVADGIGVKFGYGNFQGQQQPKTDTIYMVFSGDCPMTKAAVNTADLINSGTFLGAFVGTQFNLDGTNPVRELFEAQVQNRILI